MAQARVYLPVDTEHAAYLKSMGFRFCNKDQRFERNCSNPEEYLKLIQDKLPQVRTDFKR